MPAPTISIAVEGVTDEAVAKRLIRHIGARAGNAYGKQGKQFLRDKMIGFNQAAKHSPWLIIVDLDTDFDCAPPLRRQWLPDPSIRMCFRVAVREVEAWLLADAKRIAAFLDVGWNKVPTNPESLPDPKAEMVRLARASRRREIREDMVPREGSGLKVGPAYSSRLIEFTKSHWCPDVAAERSESLRRAIRSLRMLARREIS